MTGEAAACWALTTGEAGMVSQAVGLAEAVGLDFAQKTIALEAPWRWLPPRLCPFVLHGLRPDADALAPPWPRLLITCGRRSVAAAIAIRRLSGGRTFTVHVQSPHVPAGRFDLVAAPRHDELAGANVVATRGAINRVTPARLAAAAERVRACFAGLPRPLVAVLVGGTSGRCRLTAQRTAALAEGLAALTRNAGAGLVVTTSRRTGAANEAVLTRALAGLPAWIWDGGGENPYFGMLGSADHIVVTADSVSMVSEAAATGRPVYVFDLESDDRRLAAFHRLLRADGVTRPFDGRLESWSYRPLDDTIAVAGEVRRRMAERGLEPAGARRPA